MARPAAETEEAGGEGYFASVSDLMVGILFVFLLMLTVFALNYRDAEQEQVVALDRYERLRLEADAARRKAEEQEAEAARLADLVRRVLTEAERERAEAIRQAEFARLAQVEASRQEAEAVRQAELAQLAQAEAGRQEAVAMARQIEADALRARNERLQSALDAAVLRLQHDIREREEARADLLTRLAAGLAARGVTFRIDQQSGVLRLSEDVPFLTGSAELTDRTRRTVNVLAEVLTGVLPCFAAGSDASGCGARDAPILEAVLVEGHTDRQVFRGLTVTQSVLENDRLSAGRALSVFAELRRVQPALEGLRNSDGVPLLGVSGYGERRLVAAGATEADHAQNRRIDLRFVLSARTSEEVRRLIEQIDQLRRGGG